MEMADPDLIIERYRKHFRKLGMSEDQIDERILGLLQRGKMVKSMGKMGCRQGKHFGCRLIFQP